MNVTTADLATRWSFGDLMDAHDVLDALEDAERRAAKQARNG
jgi:hypothetical protein